MGADTLTANSTLYRAYALNAYAPDGGSATFTVLPGLNSNIPAMLTNIKKVSGSWSNPVLKTNSDYITATINGISGTITSTGLTITYAQAISLFSNKHTVTFKNSRQGAYSISCDINMFITNTSSSTQYYIYALSGLYE